MIIIITSENKIINEAQKINQLFEAGLQCLHFRKPTWTVDEFKQLLNEIDLTYHNKIVIHHYHELINEFNLKGIHFTEQKRIDCIDNPSQYFKELNMFGKTISSSFHEPEVLANCEFEFDYYFLSPVFSSISKQGYAGRSFDVNHINKTIIALGGINETNIKKAYQLGFNGIAVLGSIWKSENSFRNFYNLKETQLKL